MMEISKPMSESIKSYWAKVHSDNLPSKLTGNGENTLDILACRDYFLDAKRILNIGVGIGSLERYISDCEKIVDSLDICEEAILKVAAFSRLKFLDAGLLPTSEYDLITECFVALHLDRDEMSRHIKNCVRALSSNGIWCFNAPSYYEGEYCKGENHSFTEVDAMQCGYALCRPISWYANEIYVNGGQIYMVKHTRDQLEYNKSDYIYHVKKRKEGN